MSKIYIFSPGNIISGGVNSLHNLCRALVNSGFDASMVYTSRQKNIVESDIIKSFQVTEATAIDDSSSNCIVVPETMTALLVQYPKSTNVVYWLSIKFFFKNQPYRFPFTLKLFRKLISCTSYYGYPNNTVQQVKRSASLWNKANDVAWQQHVRHIVNAQYTYEFLKSLGKEHIHLLHNPVRQSFYNKPVATVREKTLLFGPKTSVWFMKRVAGKYPDYTCIRLKRLDPHAIPALYRSAMLFVELGHSGRDRMPREAVLSGCVVLCGNIGSAAYFNDLQLPPYYKIDVTRRYEKIVLQRIGEIISDYQAHYANMQPLLNYLTFENANFESNTTHIFEKLLSGK